MRVSDRDAGEIDGVVAMQNARFLLPPFRQLRLRPRWGMRV
jgi:hypothetical protein